MNQVPMDSTLALGGNISDEKVSVSSPRVADAYGGPPLPKLETQEGYYDPEDKLNEETTEEASLSKASDNIVRLTPNSSIRRGKVYKLDNATEILVPSLAADEVGDEEESEATSSDDDSSYFRDPSNLPSPKSATRKYSWGSAARESDASLSLSEDSESENERGNQRVADLHAHHQIVRMHSLSSLVSTNSLNSDDDEEDIDRTEGLPKPADMRPPPLDAWLGANRGISEHTLQYSEDGSSHNHRNATPNSFDPSNSTNPSQKLGGTQQLPSTETLQSQAYSVAEAASRELNADLADTDHHDEHGNYKVYWQRWLMLFYMSTLNLLSDWTCYSVAPIAVMTEDAFGSINPELLVTIFLSANAITTICEPILLSRLGLRRTVIFGALLLMIGSIVKSGGMPPIIRANIEKGHGEWQVYLGFFLVGLSQPLYQCTPALLSASWFPERERTMATGVALNANQLGIGFAFVFGTLLVATSDDIPNYFGLLSILSTIVFLGTLIQFDDAPPTPPSDTARVMRGTLPQVADWGALVESVRGMAGVGQAEQKPKRTSRKSKRKSSSPTRKGKGQSTTRRRNVSSAPASGSAAPATAGLRPSAARYGAVGHGLIHNAPSPMMPGPVAATESSEQASQTSADETDDAGGPGYPYYASGPYGTHFPPYGEQPPPMAQSQAPYTAYEQPPPYALPPPPQPMWDPRFQQWVYPPPPPPHYYAHDPYYYNSYQHHPIPPYPPQESMVMNAPVGDEGAEPVLRMTPHHLDIDIRDDQVLRSIRACFRRPGFVHALVAFAVSGIVINTLSTFMDYLVRLNGVGREYTGIVGGSFQFCIMISSLIVGRICDSSRAYYSVTIGMLVLGAFGLAQCGVSLDGDRGTELRWSLVIVAVLVGPLQPVSTELGVEVVYPLSENTVLVIQQLFSNLLSAMFIPFFKAMKDIGSTVVNEDDATFSDTSYHRPEYTVSFYVLIVLHAAATVCFATFNGRYLRFEHELDKKAEEEAKRQLNSNQTGYRDNPPPELAQQQQQFPPPPPPQVHYAPVV